MGEESGRNQREGNRIVVHVYEIDLKNRIMGVFLCKKGREKKKTELKEKRGRQTPLSP